MMQEDTDYHHPFKPVILRSVMGWAIAVLIAMVTAILVHRPSLPNLLSAQIVMGILGFIGGLSQTYSIRTAGEEISPKQSLLLAFVWSASCIGGVTPLFFTFGHSIKMAFLGFSSFFISGALGGLATGAILCNPNRHAEEHNTISCVAIWAISFGFAALSLDLFSFLFQIILPKSISMFVAFAFIAGIIGIGNGFFILQFYKAGNAGSLPINIGHETTTRVDNTPYILTVVLLTVPFYLNDISNIFVKDWRWWLFLDFVFVKLVPLTIVFWVIHKRIMKPDEFGLMRPSWAGFLLVFIIGALLGNYLFQSGYVLFRFIPGYLPLGHMPKIENPFLNGFDLTVGILLVGITEELVFRAYMATFITRYTKRASVIVLISAVAFGLIHWSEGFNHVMVTAIFGAVFMMLYLRFRSLPALMLAHFTVNFVHLTDIFPKSIFRL